MRVDDGVLVTIGSHWCGATQVLAGRPPRLPQFCCPADQVTHLVAATPQRSEVGGLAVIAMLDTRGN